MSRLIGELQERLPVTIESCEYREYSLLISGAGWRFRVSGPWRLINSGMIETSSSEELRNGRGGRIDSIRGKSILEIGIQSRVAKLDIVLFLSGGTALEVFSESAYDDWLLTLGELVVEGPMHGLADQL